MRITVLPHGLAEPLFFFLIYSLFNTLSIVLTLQCLTVGWLVHTKLQNIWQAAVTA